MTEFSKADLTYIGIIDSKYVCGADNHNERTYWCEHIHRMIDAGADADMLYPDQHIWVPIFPSINIFAEVWIGVDVGNGAAIMSMSFTPDIGAPYSVRLGFWNPGEGMRSIRGVILDYMKSKLDPDESFFGAGPILTKCPNRAHGLKSAQLMNEKCFSRSWKQKCLWNIVMERACTPCIEESGGVSDNNFGIDESILRGNWSR